MPKSKLDPLFAAIIAKLPSAGATWESAEREAWLHMMTSAFDVVYGREELVVSGQPAMMQDWVKVVAHTNGANGKRKPGRPAKPKIAPHAGHDFYIDQDGHAMRDGGGRVNAQDIPSDEVIYDYRGAKRNRDTIVWADGSTGAKPGMAFGGPG